MKTIEKYKGFDLHIMEVQNNPNGRKTQTVLIYKNNEVVKATHSDIELENAINKAKIKIDKMI